MSSYSLSIISLIDILGFKEMINVRRPEEVYKILEKFREFSGATDQRGDFEKKHAVFMKTFSDMLIRTVNLETNANLAHPAGFAFYEIHDLALAQIDMVNMGIFLRGAVTLGGIFHDDQFVFGPGFLRAFELEKAVAKYPRIILDTHFLDGMEKYPKLMFTHDESDKAEIMELLRQDFDGVWFIDYVKIAQAEVPEKYLIFCSNHKKAILDFYNQIPDKENISEKSLKVHWLVGYHNLSISQDPNWIDKKLQSELLIRSDEVHTLYQ